MTSDRSSQNMTDLEQAAASLRSTNDRISNLTTSLDQLNDQQKLRDMTAMAEDITESAGLVQKEYVRLNESLKARIETLQAQTAVHEKSGGGDEVGAVDDRGNGSK